MLTLEKTLILSLYELRLLIRGRAALLVLAAFPILAGIVLGLASKGEAAAAYGVFLILPISALLLAVSLRTTGLLPPGEYRLAGPVVSGASRALVTLVVLAAQGALYAGTTAVLAPGSVPGIGMLLAALAVSLALGVAAEMLTPAHRFR
ncbi:MAG: hypothetical protein NTU88_05325 [Armatimonadetes bacterium]|nr:hypothetical protein [Armatimonadota bacterium]